MPLTHDTEPTRADHLQSLDQLVTLEAEQYFHIATALEEEIGRNDAADNLATGLRSYGQWRGQQIADRHERDYIPHTLPSLLHHWGSGDVHGLSELDWGQARATERQFMLHIDRSPSMHPFVASNRLDLAGLWWKELISGVTESYLGYTATDLEVNVDSDSTPPSIRIWLDLDSTANSTSRISPTDPYQLPPIQSSALGDSKQAARVLRDTVDGRAALLVFLGRAMTRAFDASGEHAFRVGIQRFGAERGSRLREKHRNSGKQLNLANMIADFDYGGEDLWKFRDSGTLTPTTWHQDCTYCPFASVWRQLGGLNFGLIYDVEFHEAQFKAYNPNIRVKWTQLQTRGDSVCEFRFELPANTLNPDRAAS